MADVMKELIKLYGFSCPGPGPNILTVLVTSLLTICQDCITQKMAETPDNASNVN